MDTERAGTQSRWRWWMAVPIVAVAFAAGYGITKLGSNGGSSETQTAPAKITFEQGHTTPLGITEPDLVARIPGPPALIQQRRTHPPETCRWYPLTDQPEYYVFCFANGKLVLAHTATKP